MQKIIDKLVGVLVTNAIIAKDDKEIYQYGLWAGFLFLINVIVALGIVIMTHEILPGIIFLLFLIVIRSYAGGYHCKSPVSCFLLSQGCIFVSLCVIRASEVWMSAGNIRLFLIVYGLTCIPILGYGPRPCEANPLEDEEIKRYKKTLFLIYGIMTALVLVSVLLNNPWMVMVALVVNGNLLMAYLLDVVLK